MTYGQLVSGFVSGTHLGPVTSFCSFFLKLFLGSYGFVHMGRPLRWDVGPVVFSCCWASPAQSFSGLSPGGLRPYFTVSVLSPPTWRPRFLYFSHPEKGWPSYTLRHRLKTPCGRQPVCQSVLVSGHHLRPRINFSFSIEIIDRHFAYFLVWGSLSDEGTGL
jgi:hypothetical protein